MAKNEAKIKFTAETGEFNDAIKKSNDEMSELRAELKLNEVQMEHNGKSVEGLEKKHKLLDSQLKASQDKTEALTAKVKKAVEIFGENSSEAMKLKAQLANAQTAEEKARKAVSDCNKELEEQGRVSTDLDGKLGKLAVGVAAVGAAMVAFGKEAIEAFNEVDEGADNVIKATGATGEAAAELEESYKKVASSIVGDFGDIGSTLGEVNTRFGYTGTEAEDATEKFLKFAEITGVDSVSAVQAVSRALNDAGIPLNEYDTLLDQLAKAGQAAGIDVTTLADSLSENGSIMRSMGFDTQETIALLAQFELSGANSSVMLTGMKKAMASWADSGKDGSKEFANMVKGIQDGSVSASTAIDVFGTKAGPMLVDAIQSGKFEYQDMLSVIENSEGTLENTFDATVDGGYELELAMQNAKMALAEAGGEIGTALVPALKTFSENVLPVATKAIGAMVDGITAAVGWMKEHKGVVIAVASVVGILTTAITAYNIVQGIKTAMDAAQVTTVWALVAAHWAQATAAMAALAPYILIVAAIAAVIAIIVLCVKYWDQIKEAGAKAWQGIKNAWKSAGEWFGGVWAGIKNVFSNIGKWFSDKFNAAKQGVQNAWSGVKGWFSNIWSGIKTAFSNVGTWFSNTFNKAKEAIVKPIEAAKAKIKSVVDSIKGFFSNLKLKFPNIKLPHFKITGKFSLDPPSVPKLKIDWYNKAMASPMILNGATIFGHANGKLLGGGETGSEMIGGTSTVMQMIQSAVDRSMQAMNINALAAAVEDLANRPIELNVNGRQFALATAGDSDRVNGMRNRIIERGVLLD